MYTTLIQRQASAALFEFFHLDQAFMIVLIFCLDIFFNVWMTGGFATAMVNVII